MTERVDIANLSLSWLGAGPITSLEDDIDRARQMRINYIPARDATLEAHTWTFALKRFIPGASEPAPEYGAAYAYTIPPDILRVIAVDRTGETAANRARSIPINSQEQIDWQVEENRIICNEEQIFCRGIRRVEEEGRFSPLFVHAFAAKLASLTALNLTASAEIQENMFGLYERFIAEAKSRDGLQGRSRRIRNRSLVQSR